MSRYQLGPVKPWVEAAAYEIGPKFGITEILGWGTRPNPTDHDDGLALDFMTTVKGTGDPLAAYAQANAARLGITYVIWWQRIWSVQRSSEGWRPMEDRGSITANHKNHVHVSFNPTAPKGFKAGQAPQGGDWNTNPTVPQIPSTTPPSGQAQQTGLVSSTVDQVQRLVLLGVFLFGGVALIGLGAAKLAAPSRQKAADTGMSAASLLIPEARAATAATAKGAAT